jgi:hypothetical protein
VPPTLSNCELPERNVWSCCRAFNNGTAPFGSSLVAAMSTALAIIKCTKAKPFFADGVDISLFGRHRIIETSLGEVCGGWSMCRLQMCECFRRGVVVDWWLFCESW